MSFIGPKRAVEPALPVHSEPQDECAPSSTYFVQPTNIKEELQPQELLLLREFFLLLDQWDRQQQG